MPGQFTIEIVQAPLLGGVAAHNFLQMKNGQGQVVGELHGLATGLDGEPMSIGWAPWHKLKFYDDRRWDGATAERATLFTGTEAQAQALWARATYAGQAMNYADIGYSMFGFDIFSPTENSNALASTLIAAMGLSEPTLSGRLTPGAGNLLLSSSSIAETQALIPIPSNSQGSSGAGITSPLTPIGTSEASQYFLVSSGGISYFTPADSSTTAVSLFASSSGLDIHSSFSFTSFAGGNIGFGSGSYFDIPAGVQTSSGWYSWDVSSLNIATSTLLNDIFASTGNSSLGEQLGYHIDHQSSGDWRVSVSGLSGSRSSPLLERVRSATEPHGTESFLKWFYDRIEEWQRDVNIVSRVPIRGNDLTDIGNLAALVDDASQADSDSTNSNTLVKGQLTLAGDEWNLSDLPTAVPNTEPAMLQIATAANALIESMAHWNPSASDSGAFTDAASRKNLAYWSDLAPASLA